jgi:K+ transporter
VGRSTSTLKNLATKTACAFFVVLGLSVMFFIVTWQLLPQKYHQIFNGGVFVLPALFVMFCFWCDFTRRRCVLEERFHRQCPLNNSGVAASVHPSKESYRL